MSMTETPAAAPAAKKPTKRKPRKTPRRASFHKPAPAEAKPPGEFDSMTTALCAKACNVNGCVVSGKPYCAHPCKGGLQAGDASNQAALHRLRAAQKMLGIEAVENKFA